MKRNWYAALLLLALGALLFGCGKFTKDSTDEMKQNVRAAYACTLRLDYTTAAQQYRVAAEQARQSSALLGLIVRRNLLDRVNESMATLPSYATPDNQADLSVETARVCAQIDQMAQSFLGWL